MKNFLLRLSDTSGVLVWSHSLKLTCYSTPAVSSLKTRSRRLRVLRTSHFAFWMFNEQVLRTSHLAGGHLIWGRTSHLGIGDLIWMEEISFWQYRTSHYNSQEMRSPLATRFWCIWERDFSFQMRSPNSRNAKSSKREVHDFAFLMN